MTPFRAFPAVVLFAVARSAISVADPMRIEVHAAGNCPSAEAVSAELGRIAADSGETRFDRGQADVFESPRGLQVRLGRAAGGTDGERTIETSADCAERAIAAAVVIASWQTDLRSEVELALRAVGARSGATPSWFPSAGVAGVGVASGTGAWAAGSALDLQLAHRTGWGARVAVWGTSYRSVGLGTDSGRATVWVWLHRARASFLAELERLEGKEVL